MTPPALPANFPLLFSRISFIIQKLSGCGPVGRAPGLGPGCREFESRHSDQKSRIRFCGVWTFLFVWSETRTNKCDCPVDSRLPTARRRQHLYFLPSGKKMQTSLATLDYQRAINKDMIAESLFFTSFCGHYFGHRFKCTTKILFSNQT